MNKWTGKSIFYNVWSLTQLCVVIFLMPFLLVLQSNVVFAQEDNSKNTSKNLNTPFFGQDPAQLGQQYTDQEVADQKKMDAATANKSKAKDKNASGSAPKQNLPPPAGNGSQPPPPNYTAPPMLNNTEQNPGIPSPNDVPKPAGQPNPAPSNELIRGY